MTNKLQHKTLSNQNLKHFVGLFLFLHLRSFKAFFYDLAHQVGPPSL